MTSAKFCHVDVDQRCAQITLRVDEAVAAVASPQDGEDVEAHDSDLAAPGEGVPAHHVLQQVQVAQWPGCGSEELESHHHPTSEEMALQSGGPVSGGKAMVGPHHFSKAIAAERCAGGGNA